MGSVRILKRGKKGFTGGLDLSDPNKLFSAKPEVAEAYRREALKIVTEDRHAATEYVRVYFQSALDGVLDALRNPGVSVGAVSARSRVRPDKYADRLRAARSKTVRISPSQASVSKGAPKTLVIKTKPWATLGVRYQLSNPVSRQYWKKGRSAVSLYDDVKAALPSGHVSMSTIKPKLVVDRTRGGDRNKLLRYRYTISLPVLPWPLDELIRESFVSGVPQRASRGVADASNFTRLVYVEGRRPMIAAIAARTGEELKKSLAARTRISMS